ncbi:hypothetical protein Droror1_Dr00024423 [Drosera rotundifolia]
MAATITRRLASNLIHRQFPSPNSSPFTIPPTSRTLITPLSPPIWHRIDPNQTTPFHHLVQLTKPRFISSSIEKPKTLISNFNPQIDPNQTTPFLCFTQFTQPRCISSSIEKPSSQNGDLNDYPSKGPQFKHQEIEGPTVERDLSALANETREVLDRLMRTLYDLSRVLGVLGLVQLGYGAWVSYVTKDLKLFEVTVMSVAAFGFPFSVAFLIRRSVKDMRFFEKMEGIGRLQLMTSTMQIAKNLNVMFVRIRGVCFLCVGGLSCGLLFAILSR